ncbi:hypothetical protein ACFU5E_12865 [Aeromonas bestiarum]|uniref:Uncharacterized protein n=1 Tax=Aeromonas bestiarum TaxID=105751 RepID=A0ABT7PU25_9GAMM|nr:MULTISPECIES: hypothetical protein [Aeromonas]MDM5070441.1 hypothetical protein [Aeromonas bestiarum]
MTLGFIGKSHLRDGQSPAVVALGIYPQPVISLVQGFQNLVLR